MSWRSKEDGSHYKIEERSQSSARPPARSGRAENDRVFGVRERILVPDRFMKLPYLEREFLDGRITQQQYESRRLFRDKRGEHCNIKDGLCMNHGYSVSASVACPIGGGTDPSVNPVKVSSEPLQVKEVRLMRAEGPTEECGKWQTFKSIDEADQQLTRNSQGMPKDQLGCDKHDFVIVFTNGQTYEGRYDLEKREVGDIRGHVKGFGKYYTSKEYQKAAGKLTPQEKAGMLKVMKAMDQDQKKKPAAKSQTQFKTLAQWKAERDAIWNETQKYDKEEKDHAVAVQKANAKWDSWYATQPDMRPLVKRTSIGHYGGLWVEVPAANFEKFKSQFPAKEFPRKVSTNPDNGNKKIYFADRSAGEQRLEYMRMPIPE